jgi:putative membrane protein insertion efficiency factor
VPRATGRAVSALLIALIRLYKIFISPIIPSSCRFHPSCSDYAIAALEKHGLLKGFALSAWRILRCGPWSHGGYDPVPEFKERAIWTRKPG